MSDNIRRLNLLLYQIPDDIERWCWHGGVDTVLRLVVNVTEKRRKLDVRNRPEEFGELNSPRVESISCEQFVLSIIFVRLKNGTEKYTKSYHRQYYWRRSQKVVSAIHRFSSLVRRIFDSIADASIIKPHKLPDTNPWQLITFRLIVPLPNFS